MSDADRSTLDAMMAEWERGEFWNAEPFAEDVVFVVSGPDAAVYHGIDGLAEGWRSFLAAWDDFRIEHDGIVAGPGGTYALLLRLCGRGKGSGLEIDAEVANVVSMRGGRLTRLEMFWDRDAALRAVRAGGGPE